MATIKFFLDEDVNTLVAAMLRAEGLSCESVSELRRKGLDDDIQLEFAIESRFVIVTHNRTDFEELSVEYFNTEKDHAGIVISSMKAPRLIADDLIDIATRFTADETVNQMIYI